MKYHLHTFTEESEATKYPNSVSVLYCVNGFLIIGHTHRSTIPFKLLKEYIKIVKMLLGDDIEAIIKFNH